MLTSSHRLDALVTGATGALGPVLVHSLLEQGYQVRALARRKPQPDILPPSVKLYQGDITDSKVIEAAISGVDVVFHLAAKLHIANPDPSLYAEYECVNVEGTHCLVEAAQTAGVKRLIYFSTIAVYGPSQPGQVIDETTPLHPQTIYAKTKQQAEKIALNMHQAETGEPLAVVLRLAAVYGPYIKGNYARLVSAMRKGWFVPIGDGRNRRTLIYDQDVAAAAILAAEHPKAIGQIYNITDGQIYTFDKIITAISQALGRRAPRFRLPVLPVRIIAAIAEHSLGLIGRKSPVGRATVDKLLEDVAVSSSKIQVELGFRPRIDLTIGWRETISQITRQ